MPLAPVSRLKKKEIVWLSNHKCKHSHSFLEHYNCYLSENPKKLRIGFFDIETSNFKADFGVMLCYCIKLGGSDTILERVATPKELLGSPRDKEVVRQCVEDLSSLDRVVTYYGARFDLPFLRTRALYWGIPFPAYGSLSHDDIYFTVRGKFCLSRNRMENACRTLLGKTEKNHFDGLIWMRALQGDKKSMAMILDHCQRDVRDLERLYHAVIDFKRYTESSI